MAQLPAMPKAKPSPSPSTKMPALDAKDSEDGAYANLMQQLRQNRDELPPALKDLVTSLPVDVSDMEEDEEDMDATVEAAAQEQARREATQSAMKVQREQMAAMLEAAKKAADEQEQNSRERTPRRKERDKDIPVIDVTKSPVTGASVPHKA